MGLPADVLARRDLLPVKPAPVTLRGSKVELRPLIDADFEALHLVSNGQPFTLGDRRADVYDAYEAIWKWMKGGAFANVTELRADLAPQVVEDDALVLTVLDRPSNVPVGVVCYMTNRPKDLKIELGSIWYGPIAQGTGASREATMLLLGHAFDLGYRRIEWKCDALNERSRRAALSYGFTYEGIQQAHMIVKNRNRDTAWFRMLDVEWPAIRDREAAR